MPYFQGFPDSLLYNIQQMYNKSVISGESS